MCVCHNLLSLCSSGILTSAGAAEAFLLERNSICDFSDAICHSTDSFFMPESGGFSPHGAALSTTASASLSLSLSLWRWRHAWRFTSCLTKKCSCSRLAAPGILAHDLCGGGWTLSGRIPSQGGARVAPHGGRLFSCHMSSRLHRCPLGLVLLSFCEGHSINNPQVLDG